MGLLQTGGVVNTQVFPVRTQRNSAFQGLYTYLDLFDGTWRDREGYCNDQFFKASHGAFDATRPIAEYRFEKKNPDDGDLRADPRVPERCGPDRDGAAQLPAGQRGHPGDDQLRRGHRDRPAHRLAEPQLLPESGRRHRAVGDHPVGSRPHLRQQLLVWCNQHRS